MCGRIDSYLNAFTSLRVDKNRKRWPAATYHCSPYKPFLLLAVLDQIESAQITRNFISPSFELTRTWLNYIATLANLPLRPSMALPFYHLESADFWQLISQPGREHLRGRQIQSMAKLRSFYLGARFSDDLFPLLQMATSRKKLQTALINTYFAPEIQPSIREQSYINCASVIYSRALLHTSEAQPPGDRATTGDRIRDQGFRKAIVQLYNHRCALCGIKMLTPEGHSIVDAAHIVPWSQSRNDHPTNDMALCKLCHWSFDEGLMAVDDTYHVLISPTVIKDDNLPGHIMTLSARPMFKPEQSRFWPATENFQWHRKERFRRKV